ncbi:MAG: KH domain-containing protein [Acidimicrobiia bacterium]|nr:KH domain-containing protein [Acidimicrobiia bacterium]
MTDVDPVDDDVDANTKPAANATEVLEYLVRNVVDEPDGVEVHVDDQRASRVQLNVHVAPGDMGRVIGRRGRVANAIRTVVRAAAVRDGVDVDVEFVD